MFLRLGQESRNAQVQSNSAKNKAESSPEKVMYEEILDHPNTYNIVKCPAYAVSNEVANPCHHEYEDIKLCSYLGIHDDDNKIQQCLAHGVNDERN